MIYGVFKNGGDCFGGVYDSFNDIYNDTFSPDTETLALFDFKAHDKTYSEKKDSVRDNAIEYSNTVGGINLSMYELVLLQNYFERYGKRYGLTEEFKENAII